MPSDKGQDVVKLGSAPHATDKRPRGFDTSLVVTVADDASTRFVQFRRGRLAEVVAQRGERQNQVVGVVVTAHGSRRVHDTQRMLPHVAFGCHFGSCLQPINAFSSG